MPDLSLAGLTPHRQVNVRWDVSSSILAEPAHLLRRTSGKDIFPLSSTNTEQLASGVRVLSPENDLRILHESATAHPYILRLEDWTFSPICVEVPRQRALTELSGISPGPDVATSGDWFITKRINAGESWAQPLTPVEESPVASHVFNAPLDPIAQHPKTGIHSADQGYLIRLIVPGSLNSNVDVLFAFRFGGPIHAKGYGRFEAVLYGDGKLALYEKRSPLSGGPPEWEGVAYWQFTEYREMSSSALTIRIIPHAPKWIEFRVFAGQGIDGRLVNLSDASLAENLIHAAEHTTLQSYAHDVKRPTDVGVIGSGPFLREITGAGGIMVSVRRDLRLSFQVARIAYKASGTFIDRPFVIPGGWYSNKIVRLMLRGHQPIGDGTITGSVQGGTGAALVGGTESFTLNGVSSGLYTGVVPPGGTNAMRVSVTLTNTQTAGQRWRTPSFEGYDIQRHVTQGTFSPGEKTGGNLLSLFITGPGYHPDHETATLAIEDPTNALAAVRIRRTPVLIETTIDAAGIQKAVLFSGWTGRVTGSLKGKHGRTYPREAHHRLSADLMGQWERLANNKFTWQQIDLADANTHPLGRGGNARQAWKVTDAIWWLLYSSGFSAAELDIFDDPIRFWATKDMIAEGTMKILPGTQNIGQIAVHFARYFGNWYLVWDGGAGATGAGMWRLRRPPTAATPALCSFTLAECPAGKLQHLSASYGTLGGKPIYPILDTDGVEYRTYTQYPENNMVTVLGMVQVLPTGGRNFFWQQAINFTSWRCPGRETLADPTSPDWLGDCRPIEIPDSSLPNQASVNFVCRRIFEAACRGRVRHSFAAELVLVNVSATETFHTIRTHRPLRAGDVVNLIDMDSNVTKCVVHSANFSIEKSHVQKMYLELEEFRENVTLGGWRTK